MKGFALGKLVTHFAPVCLLTLTFGAASASAGTMWATGNDGSSLIRFDTSTAATTVVGTFTTGGTYGLAFAPDGTAYTLSGSVATLATVNLSNAALTTIGGPGGSFGYALDFAPDGTLYAVNVSTNVIDRVNTSTGVFTAVSTLSGASGIMDVTFTPTGQMYGVGSSDIIYRIDPITGIASVAFTTVLGSLMGLAADNEGNLIATSYSNPSQFETINLSNGFSGITGTIGAGTSFDHGGDIVLNQVPEPASFLLLPVVLGIGRLVRRKIAA